MDEFETFGGKKARFVDDDSDSEDTRIPNALIVKMSPNIKLLHQALANALVTAPQTANSAIFEQNRRAIVELLTGNSNVEDSGW